MTDTMERREAIVRMREALERARHLESVGVMVKFSDLDLVLSLPAREGSEERARTYADFQQRRGRLPDLIEEALSIYDEFMKDDAYDAQRPLDQIADKLRRARDFYDALATDITADPRIEGMEAAVKSLLPYAIHSVGCAIYQRSWVSGEPPCTCGLNEARATFKPLAGKA